MAEVVDLIAALEATVAVGQTKATSVRLPEAVQRATALAVEMGMDDSVTAAMTNALLDRVAAFARRRALAEHFAAYPADAPTLHEVVARRLEGSGHVGERHPEVVERISAHVADGSPEWLATGAVDAAVDTVISIIEAVDGLGLLPMARPAPRARAQSAAG